MGGDRKLEREKMIGETMMDDNTEKKAKKIYDEEGTPVGIYWTWHKVNKSLSTVGFSPYFECSFSIKYVVSLLCHVYTYIITERVPFLQLPLFASYCFVLCNTQRM